MQRIEQPHTLAHLGQFLPKGWIYAGYSQQHSHPDGFTDDLLAGETEKPRRLGQGDYFGGNFACAQDKPIAEALSRVKECGGQSWP